MSTRIPSSPHLGSKPAVKVSIIVPTYNAENFLYQCLESIVNQTLKDIEIILVNDGSKDSSLEILKSYAARDKRIVLIDQKNKGYGGAVNAGLKVARGEYVGIVEPDDFIDIHMYEALYSKRHGRNGTIDLIKSKYSAYYDTYKDKIAYEKTINVCPIIANQEISPLGWYEGAGFLLTSHSSLWCAIYKREMIVKNNIKVIETPGASYQDFSFSLECFFAAKSFYFLDKSLYKYRQTNPNCSSKQINFDLQFTFLRQYFYMKRIISGYGPKKRQQCKIFLILHLLHISQWDIDRCSPEYFYIYLKNYLKVTHMEDMCYYPIRMTSGTLWTILKPNLISDFRFRPRQSLFLYTFFYNHKQRYNRLSYLVRKITRFFVNFPKAIVVTLYVIIIALFKIK